jgi:hypothetical protein
LYALQKVMEQRGRLHQATSLDQVSTMEAHDRLAELGKLAKQHPDVTKEDRYIMSLAKTLAIRGDDGKPVIETKDIEKFFGGLTKLQREQLMADLSRDRTVAAGKPAGQLFKTLDDFANANGARKNPSSQIAALLSANPDLLKERTTVAALSKYDHLFEVRQYLKPEQLKILDASISRLRRMYR